MTSEDHDLRSLSMAEASFLLQLLFCWIVVSCFLVSDVKYDLCLGSSYDSNLTKPRFRFDMIGPPVS